MLFCIFLLLLCPLLLADTLTVSRLSSGKLQVKNNGVIMFEEPLVKENNHFYSTYNGNIKFDRSPVYRTSAISSEEQDLLLAVDVNISEPVYQLNTKGYVRTMNDNTNIIQILDDRPYIVYMSQQTGYICERVLKTSWDPFQCLLISNGMINTTHPVLKFRQGDPGMAYTEINVLSDMNISITYEAISIAASRLASQRDFITDTENVRKHNLHRREVNRVAVVFIWIFMALSMAFFLAILGHYQIWWNPILNHPRIMEKIPIFNNLMVTFWVWWFFWILISILVCALSGLAGFIFLGTIYFIFNVTFSIIYTYKHHHQCWNKIFICCKNKSNSLESSIVAPEAVELKSENDDNNNQHQNKVEEEDNNNHEETPPPTTTTTTSDPHKRNASIAVIEIQRQHTQDIDNRIFATTYPDEFVPKHGHRVRLLWISFFIMFLLWGITILGWNVDEYKIWHRHDSVTVVEYIPEFIAKGVATMYAYDGYAEKLKLNNFMFDLSTQFCGEKYNSVLNSKQNKKTSIYDSFIKKYDIDMSIYARQSYEDYHSVNDWFTRSLAPNVRPISNPNNTNIFVSPADARIMAFERVPFDQRFWIKDNDFSIKEMVGSSSYISSFYNAPMVIIRLSPQDYHRFHSPVSGHILSMISIEGGLHSVNADGMTSSNGAIYNTRTVVVIEADDNKGKVAFVAVGATCVGSVVMLNDVGDHVVKGDEFGYFQFGGSTVALVFEQGSVVFDEDILYHSQRKVESLTTANSRLGMFL